MRFSTKPYILSLIFAATTGFYQMDANNNPLGRENLEKTKINLNLDKIKPEQREMALDRTIKTLIENSQKVSLYIFTKALFINVEKTKFQNIYSLHIQSKDKKLNKTIFSGPEAIKKSAESAISNFLNENPDKNDQESFLKKYRPILIGLGIGIPFCFAIYLKNKGFF